MTSLENVGGELTEIADEADKLVDGPMAAMRERLDGTPLLVQPVVDDLSNAAEALARLGETLDAQRAGEFDTGAALNGLRRRLGQVAKGTNNDDIRRAETALETQAEAMTAEHRTSKHQELLLKAGTAIEWARLAVEEVVELSSDKRDRIEESYLGVSRAASDIRDAAEDL